MNKLVIECMGFEKGKTYGFQEYLYNLLGYMHEKRNDLLYDEIIIACKPSQETNFVQYSLNFTVQGIKGSESYNGRLLQQTMLPFTLNLKNSDTILFPGNFSGVIKRCHHVLVIHDLLFKHTHLYNNTKKRIQRELFLRPSVKLADMIIGISEFVVDEVKHYYPNSKSKILPIYNYINFGKYGCDYSQEDKGYFITVAANYKHKNIATIFKAYKRYCEAGGVKSLKLIGQINEESEAGIALKMLPKGVLERIVFYKDISNEELGLLYRHASAFISASRFEGFGMPIAEAMFFHLPLLLADTEIHREISKNSGLYFTPHDDQSLAKLMLDLNSERKDYGEEIINSYNEKNTSANYIKVLNQLLT